MILRLLSYPSRRSSIWSIRALFCKLLILYFSFKDMDGITRMHICELIQRMLDREIAIVILAVNLGDSLAIADRVLQVRHGGKIHEYLPEIFWELPTSTPWCMLYEDISAERSTQQTIE